MNENYILGEHAFTASSPNRMWYCMTEEDKTNANLVGQCFFADKCYVITTKKMYIFGNDGAWYEM